SAHPHPAAALATLALPPEAAVHHHRAALATAVPVVVPLRAAATPAHAPATTAGSAALRAAPTLAVAAAPTASRWRRRGLGPRLRPRLRLSAAARRIFAPRRARPMSLPSAPALPALRSCTITRRLRLGRLIYVVLRLRHR